MRPNLHVFIKGCDSLVLVLFTSNGETLRALLKTDSDDAVKALHRLWLTKSCIDTACHAGFFLGAYNELNRSDMHPANGVSIVWESGADKDTFLTRLVQAIPAMCEGFDSSIVRYKNNVAVCRDRWKEAND